MKFGMRVLGALGLTTLLLCISVKGQSQPRMFEDIHEPWQMTAKDERKTKRIFYRNSDGDAYHSYDVLNYDLNLAVDPKVGSIRGQNSILFLVTNDGLSKIVLDAVDLEIQRISWQDGSDLLYTKNETQVFVTLPFEMQKGQQGRLTVQYSALRPESLTVVGPDASREKRVNSAYTYTQPDGSRRWFPSHDIPSDKTITRLHVTVPKGYRVASNGIEYRPVKQPDRRVTFTFDSHVSIATYLSSVVISPLKFDQIGNWRGVPLTIAGPSYYMPALRGETKRTKQMFETFERFTQTAYPFNKYLQTVAEGARSSMEHQTATTMGGLAVVGDGTGESIVAHELAHQWFGDLVTCHVWGEMWLNEGFASYLPRVFYASVGDYKRELFDNVNQRYWYFVETNEGGARPLSTQDEWPSYNIFDSHSYQKGSLVIHLMRHIANAMAPAQNVEAFSQALGRYFRDNRFKNVSYTHLQKALEDTTGKSWERFFKEWVVQAGHPQLEASWAWQPEAETLSLKVIQAQTQRPVKPWGTFSFPLSATLVFVDGTSETTWFNVQDVEHDFSVPAKKQVKAVVLDAGLLVPSEILVKQDLSAWSAAYLVLKSGAARAQIIDSVFKADQFSVEALKPVLTHWIQATTEPVDLAFIAIKLDEKKEFLAEAKTLIQKSKQCLAGASYVEKMHFAYLESWIVRAAPAEERPSFEVVYSEWKNAERFHQRLAWFNALSVVDVKRAQKLAISELKKQHWTDRDRVTFVKALTSPVTEVSKPIVMSLLNNHASAHVSRAMFQYLLDQKFADPDVFPLLRNGALTHRNSVVRESYVKLMALQVSQAPAACTTLKEVQDEIQTRGSRNDRDGLKKAVEAAQKDLHCAG